MPDPSRTHPARRSRTCLALIVMTALCVVACGRTEEVKLPGPDATTPELGKIEFVARANEICRATTKAIAARTEDLGPSTLGGDTSADEVRELHDATQAIASLAIARLKNLTPPRDETALVRHGIDAMQAELDAARADPTRPVDPVALIQPELFDYGLTGCFAKR